ncbi:DUF6115 domain-containing protein [Lachnospiraceae bacterium ZAX-1]
MTTVEIVLIVIGIILMIGSFFLTEKLTQKDLEEISKLSTVAMKRILEKNMSGTKEKIDAMIEESIDQSIDKVDIALDKETNEKIKAISEFSDTVLESIHKTHNEVMFLYSMLNDKHADLVQYAGKLQKLKSDLEQLEEDVVHTITDTNNIALNVPEKENVGKPAALSKGQKTEKGKQNKNSLESSEAITSVAAKQDEEEIVDESNHNRSILNLHKQGMSVIEIARKLSLGLGEVKLVIDLYNEEEE